MTNPLPQPDEGAPDRRPWVIPASWFKHLATRGKFTAGGYANSSPVPTELLRAGEAFVGKVPTVNIPPFKIEDSTERLVFDMNYPPGYLRRANPPIQPKGDTARKTTTVNIPTLDEQQAKPVVPDNSAPGILAKARQHQLDRATTYDKPDGERSMAQTVLAFNALTSRTDERALGEDEGWLLMDCLKTVRDRAGAKPHQDSLEDKVAYASLYAESRLREAPKGARVPLHSLKEKECTLRYDGSHLEGTGGSANSMRLSEAPAAFSTVGAMTDPKARWPRLFDAVSLVRTVYAHDVVPVLLKISADVQHVSEIPINKIEHVVEMMHVAAALPDRLYAPKTKVDEAPKCVHNVPGWQDKFKDLIIAAARCQQRYGAETAQLALGYATGANYVDEVPVDSAERALGLLKMLNELSTGGI